MDLMEGTKAIQLFSCKALLTVDNKQYCCDERLLQTHFKKLWEVPVFNWIFIINKKGNRGKVRYIKRLLMKKLW